MSNPTLKSNDIFANIIDDGTIYTHTVSIKSLRIIPNWYGDWCRLIWGKKGYQHGT